MVGNKKSLSLISFLILSLLMSFTLVGCGVSKESSQKSSKNGKLIKIGVTQILEHSALDAARNGFIDALKEKGYEEGKNIKIDFQNAQGDMPTTQSIAQKFASDKVDMIYAISTPSAQAAYNATKNIPIIITAVTDPVEAGLVKSLENSQTNVTGTSDKVDIVPQFELAKKLIPSAKKVGILYNTSEKNSEIQVEEAKKAAPKYGLEIVEQGITTVNEVPQALNSILNKIDILYISTDNMVVSSLPMITNECFKNKIPIIGAEKAHVEAGALATKGGDYYDLGYETGLKAVEVLKGKKPTDVPVTFQKKIKVFINEDTAKKLNISISKDISSKAEVVKGGAK